MDIFRSRLPARQDILAVFNVVVFAVYSWSIRGFLYKVPSFLLFFRLDEILSVLAYMMALALLESLIVTAGLAAVSFLLPGKWFKQGFAYKGALAVAVAAFGAIQLQAYYKNSFLQLMAASKFTPLTPVYQGLGLALIVLIALLLLFHNIPRLQKMLVFVIEQLTVLTYLYVPLGVIGLVVVLARNIF